MRRKHEPVSSNEPAWPRMGVPSRSALAWFVIAVTLVTLVARVNDSFASGRYLWAEDGYTFFNHASSGFATLTLPYEGYLHVLSRLVAWLSSSLPLALLPVAYSGAWVVALVVMLGTIATRGRAMGMDAVTICGVALLCAFQPTSDEMFFNLTNAQWLLGVALTLQMLTRDEWPKPSWQLIAIALLCLTGPFCLVILSLVLALHFDRRPRAGTLVVLGLFVACTAIQLLFLLTTERMAGRTEHVDVASIAKALVLLFLFLPGRILEWIAVTGFWLVFGALLVGAIVKRETRFAPRTRIAVLLVVAAVAFVAASMVSGAFPPRAVRDGFNRYTWIPYSLLFFAAAMVSSTARGARLAMAACLSVICFTKFAPIARTDLHYASFVKLAEKTSVTIPIHPERSWMAWQLEVPPKAESGGDAEQRALASQVHDGATAFADLSRQRIVCEHATDIAVQVDGDHASDKTVTLSWSPSSDSKQESMERRYKRGPVRMQYAFPYPAGGVYLRSIELSDPAVVAVRQVAVFCLR